MKIYQAKPKASSNRIKGKGLKNSRSTLFNSNNTQHAASTDLNPAPSFFSNSTLTPVYLRAATGIQTKQISGLNSSTLPSRNSALIPIYLKAQTGINTKLSIGAPGDEYEQEADRVADQVMRIPNTDAAHHVEAGTTQSLRSQGRPANKNEVARRWVNDNEDEILQAKEQTGKKPQTVPGIESHIDSLRGRGRLLSQGERSFYEPRFGADFSGVRIYEGSYAASAAQTINARAFTLGSDVVFGAGEYSAGSNEGQRLLSHELTHTLQQQKSGTIRRQPVEMPPLTITVGMPSDLSSLSTPVAPGAVSMSRGATSIQRNSQLPGTLLPFTGSGWNGAEIANNLGQYDQIPGTDSDAVRCVQSVALVSHILNGPAAAVSYLGSIAVQGMLGVTRFGVRERTALRVIDYVKGQIGSNRATYGDLYWVMESVHDLFYGDTSGTPAETPDAVRSQIGPMLDMSQSMSDMNVWCSTPAELMTQAASLNPGEQFMLNTWTVSFNHYFDMAGAPATAQHWTYTATDENDRPLRTVRIHRIDTSLGKPAASQIEPNRDHKAGHQMLLYKDATDNHIKMYEPEITSAGNHTFDLTDDQSVLPNNLFHDQPAFELFRYIQLLGKIVPSSLLSGFSP